MELKYPIIRKMSKTCLGILTLQALQTDAVMLNSVYGSQQKANANTIMKVVLAAILFLNVSFCCDLAVADLLSCAWLQLKEFRAKGDAKECPCFSNVVSSSMFSKSLGPIFIDKYRLRYESS